MSTAPLLIFIALKSSESFFYNNLDLGNMDMRANPTDSSQLVFY